MGHGHHIEIKQETFVVPARAKQFSMIFMVVGLILAGIGIAKIDKSAAGHDEHAKVEVKAEEVKDVSPALVIDEKTATKNVKKVEEVKEVKEVKKVEEVEDVEDVEEVVIKKIEEVEEVDKAEKS